MPNSKPDRAGKTSQAGHSRPAKSAKHGDRRREPAPTPCAPSRPACASAS